MLTDEILKQQVSRGATTTIALNEHHVVGVPGIDVPVSDITDIGILSKRAHTASTAPVAVDILNQDVLRRTL